jgi:hypothetical protein
MAPQGSMLALAQGPASTTNAAFICNLTYDNPSLIWVISGAAAFLDSEILSLGPDNWANRLDQATTAGGSQAVSNLDCTDIAPAANCAFPSDQCADFTPPVLFHIRNAMATANAMFSSLAANYLSSAVVEGLAVDQIVVDFGPNVAMLSDAEALSAVSGALSALRGLIGAVNEGLDSSLKLNIGFADKFFTSVSGVLSVASALDPSSPAEQAISQEAANSDYISNIFTLSESAVKNVTALLFGGDGDTSTLPGVLSGPGPAGEQTSIAKFFANGTFLLPVTDSGTLDTALQPLFTGALQLYKQWLAVQTMKSSNLFIIGDVTISSSKCASMSSGLFLNGQCFYIAVKLSDQDAFNPIPSQTANTLTSSASGYNFNMSQLYQNAFECQLAFPGFNGTSVGSIAPESDSADPSLPQCWFNLPVFNFQNGPCEAISEGITPPSNLGFTESGCNPFVAKPCGRSVDTVC